MKTRTHTHPCDGCGQPVECEGEWARNHDGFPEVICTAFHLASGLTAPVWCEACREAEREACDCYRCTGRTPGPTD